MRRVYFAALALLLAFAAAAFAADQSAPAPAPNGLKMPAGYEDWAVISLSHRTDNKTMRVILGNEVAVKAARSGQTNPWPDGSILAKVVWTQKSEDGWPSAITADALVHAEFMYKDSKRFSANGTGWGWARWLGKERKPFGKDAGFEEECIRCHAPMQDRDWAFTVPAPMR